MTAPPRFLRLAEAGEPYGLTPEVARLLAVH